MYRALISICIAVVALAHAAGASQPNIILIMADDVGIEGLGCYGGTSYKTPHLDKMAANGLRFTRAYSQPLCTPTRVQLMTGKYNHRNWTSFGILDPSERTFGHAMTDAGYVTGIFGKWQLQSYDPPDLPGAEKRRGTGMHAKDAGFDRYALFHALHTEDKGSRYANPTMLEGVRGEKGTLRKYDGRYGEDVWVNQLLNFMDEGGDKPRFAYYPMALPHWPFQPTPNSKEWDPSAPQETHLRFAGDMIEYMDTAVGKLMDGLAQRKLLDDTIVIFYSDNGTHLSVTSQLNDGRAIAGGKATPRQTGIHVPLIAHWPGHIAPGIDQDIVDASDFFPTLLELAGASEELRKHPSDGISFAPRLLDPANSDTHAAESRSYPVRQSAFFWYDSRPGWDKERFNRHIFAVNKTHKLFRSGRLFRLGLPLEETPVDPLSMTAADVDAVKELGAVIEKALGDGEQPPLVDAYGREQHDLLYLPADRDETNRITKDMLSEATEIVYGDSDVPEHRLWIFNPLDVQEGELRPCVFFIHGGGWGGRPESLAAQSEYLRRRGVNTVSIHFRAPKGKVTPEDTLRDARRAYRWVVANGSRHHIDINKMIISGGSAGGHLSLALPTIPLADDPVITHMPQGLVLFNPAIDLVDGWSGGRKKCEAAKIDPAKFSPAHRVRSGLPPTFVMSGTKDSVITPQQLDAFRARMLKSKNQCEVTLYPGASHGFFNYGREGNRYFQRTMWKFEEIVDRLLR